MSITVTARIAPERMKSTRFVPPAMNAASLAAPSLIASLRCDGVSRLNGCIAHRLPRLLDCVDDAVVCTTPTEIPAHPLTDLIAADRVTLVDQGKPGHDLAGRAIATLEAVA